jgi:hypothetical protein
MSISFLIDLSNFVAKTAADNSNRGIVMVFSGANLDFPTTNKQWLTPSALVKRR